MKKIVTIGGGGHALSVIDSVISVGEYIIAGYTDPVDRENGYKYLGMDDSLDSLFEQGIQNAVVGLGYLGNCDTRDRVYEILKTIGFNLPSIVDGSATVSGYSYASEKGTYVEGDEAEILSNRTEIGEGTFIGKSSVVNAGATIGKMCIINTGTIIEHNCWVGDFTHIAVGATICGNVKVGDHTLVGAGTTVLQGVEIGMNCVIGAGATIRQGVAVGSGCRIGLNSVILSDIPQNTIFSGIWER